MFIAHVATPLKAFCILLGMGLSMFLSERVQAQDKLYYGEMDAGPRLFRFVVELEKKEGETTTATLTSWDEGSMKFKLSNVWDDEKELVFDLTASKASYRGQKVAESKEVTGKWSQAGATFDLKFELLDHPPKDEPDEIWQGTLDTVVQKLEMQFRRYGKGDDPTVFIDSLSQKAGGFKGTWKDEGNNVTITSDALRAKFSGTRSEDGNVIEGRWSQGIPLQLNLKRVEKVADAPSVARNRPQTPKPPFAYEQMEVTFTNPDDGTELAGTICKPKGNGPFPIGILISGSGPQDRDETILEHKPFFVIADHLAKQGIATLRFDDRGVGKSKGKFEHATTLDFAGDVRAAVQMVKEHTFVQPNQIGLIGHSEGGLVAPLVAADNPSVGWVVLLASPGVNGEEILYSQGGLIIAAEGGSERDQRRLRWVQEATFTKMKMIDPKDDLEPHIKEVVDVIERMAKQAENEEGAAADSEEEKKRGREVLTEMVRANLVAMHDPWFRFFASHEPAPVLERVKCPVLAINGEKDVQVDPKLNIPRIEAALKRGGNENVSTQVLPGLNHLFQTAKTGGISEYEQIEETISPLALQAISNWIIATCKRQ